MDHQFTPDQSRSQRLRQVIAFTRLSASLLAFIVAVMLAVIILEWDLFHDYHSRNGADWLLIGNFAVMLALLTLGADWRKDIPIMAVALLGGLLIESWGTQTELWIYYTELPPHSDPSRPPWWIIPAWPISSLAINRLYFIFDALAVKARPKFFIAAYWTFCIAFAVIFFRFTFHTWPLLWTKLFTLFMFIVLLFPKADYRKDFLILFAGTALGYFLERWGTTRECWIYYTQETPPLMAAPAHGIASLGFSRGVRALDFLWIRLKKAQNRPPDL